MNTKSVAERAAELGTDKWELVRALKALCRYQLKKKPMKYGKTESYSYPHYYYPREPLMSLKEAAAMLGVDEKDAEREIKLSYPVPWTREKVQDGIIAFMKQNKRFPETKDFRNHNGLPSPQMSRTWKPWNISTRDWWERRVAADKRCTASMIPYFRNVLARKEAIERIGVQNLLKAGVAEVISTDAEFGTLYRLPGETPSEPMILLKVVNSTPEPDGTFSDYYLRVPPDMTDVQEAVRWTFHGDEMLGEQPYAPLIET